MDYQSAAARLTGRCKESRKLENNTYLIRRAPDRIAVKLHSTDVITFYEDGHIILHDGGYRTVTTKARINTYFAGRVWSEHGEWFTSYKGKTVAGLGDVDETDTLRGDDPVAKRKEIRETINERNRPRNRARYWLSRARGWSVNSSNCKKGYTDKGWISCKSQGAWNRRHLQEHIGETLACGCVVENKPPVYKGTIESIMAEENQTVRVAKMRCYGIEKFFLDAKPQIIDERAGYQLLGIPMSNRTQWINNAPELMLAIKMSCTTTGAVYVNTVPNTCRDIPSALDWMFDTTDYLGTVSQQA